MPHFMIVLIPYINILNLSWIIKCLFLRNMEPLTERFMAAPLLKLFLSFFFFFFLLLLFFFFFCFVFIVHLCLIIVCSSYFPFRCHGAAVLSKCDLSLVTFYAFRLIFHS